MRYLAAFLALILASCAVGPTPERVGFNYPEAGLKFRPRRDVTCDTVRGQVASRENAIYTLMFQRTTCEIESADTRLLVSGIEGQLHENRIPLFYEIGEQVYGADKQYEFELVEEREIEISWPGLAAGMGTLRSWEITPVDGGDTKYIWGIVVEHYGNSFEFLWRDTIGNPPDEPGLEKFTHWTHGLRFSEPDVEEE